MVKDRLLGLFLITKFLPFLPASCLVRDCLALKWLKPGFREIIFPFLVTFSLFEYDLFVFIKTFISFLLLLLYPFGPFRYASDTL